jgi:hypothetical protein
MVRLALYRGKGQIGNAVIRWWTRSQYSHCELVITRGDLTIGFSSSLRDRGVRGKANIFDADHWDFLDLPFASEQRVLKHFSKTNGRPYGWVDLIRSQFFNRPGDARGDFCSEWCAAALGLPSAQALSPHALAKQCSWVIDYHNNGGSNV